MRRCQFCTRKRRLYFSADGLTEDDGSGYLTEEAILCSPACFLAWHDLHGKRDDPDAVTPLARALRHARQAGKSLPDAGIPDVRIGGLDKGQEIPASVLGDGDLDSIFAWLVTRACDIRAEKTYGGK